MRTEQQTEPTKELYESPAIEVMDIELQNVFAEGSQLQGFPEYEP